MAKQAILGTGLGFGDEGKGTTTHWLTSRYKAHTVIRLGGPQALHGVVCKNGAKHGFSQFGSGTFCGAATHISEKMVIDPYAILKEGEVLKYEHGLGNAVFENMTIHEEALVITPFQAIVCRLRELLRDPSRHGSVGIGVGETVLDAEIWPDLAIRAKDLKSAKLIRARLKEVQKRKFAEFEALADRASVIPPEIEKEVRRELAELENPDTIQWAVEQFHDLARRVRIVSSDYVSEEILNRSGTVVFESSQGVLLDRWYGFHPYTTKVRTTPDVALELLEKYGYDGRVISLGVLRAYHTRHGAGPFVTEWPELAKALPDAINKDHAWQGGFRVGYFDAVATRYALEASKTIDALVITCLDRVLPFGSWRYCNTYTAVPEVLNRREFFRRHSGEISQINVRFGSGEDQLKRQEELGRLLEQCSPQMTTLQLPRESNKNIDLLISTLSNLLGLPIFAISIGETEADKFEI